MKEKLFEMLCNDSSFKLPSANELRRELDIELSKPEPDIALVDELVKSVMEAEGIPQINVDIDEEYRKIASRKRKRIRLSPLKLIAAAACAVFLIGNLVSYKVYGKNFFSAIVTEIYYGLDLDFKNENHNSAVHNEEYDDLGIKKGFEEEGYYVEIPMYIPEGFEISNHRSNDQKDYHIAEYVLRRGEEEVCIGFQFFRDEEKVDNFGIGGNIIEYEQTTINGHDGFYLKSDDADWVTYRFDNTIAVYDFINMDSSEIEKILRSIK